MSYIEGTRFNNAMRRTPEGVLAQKDNARPFGELAAKFENQAKHALENKLLAGSILPHLQKLISVDAEDAEGICLQIAKQNPKAFPDTLDDIRQQAAYVLAVAYELERSPGTRH